MRALVIDDSRMVRLVIRNILQELGVVVLEAGDGQQGLDLIRREAPFDIVLVDWNMPVMDGLQFIQHVRADRTLDPQGREVRIMMVTTETESGQVMRALSAGANEYLMKPFNKDVMRAKLSLMDLFTECDGMARHRILIVDDSIVFRRLVGDEISADPALEVAGTAPNGRIALAKLNQLAPDLVILDVEMPEMDGLRTLAELKKTHPRLPVIMFSALTERGATETLEALSLGASDYFTKPVSEDGQAGSLAIVREQLIPKIKALCARAQLRAEKAPSPAPPAAPRPPAVPANPASRAAPGALPPPRQAGLPQGLVRVLAIGTSTGGPNALAAVIPQLPADFPVPVLVVQHMPPMFTRLLAERLASQSRLAVREAQPGAVVQPGTVWIAPGDFHMVVARGEDQQVRLLTNQDPPENSCRPAVDPLFRSVARVYGAGTLAVVMTGMGQDGLRGAELVREAGGQVLAQDEATSVVWGMPGFVARAGLADRLLPLDLIAHEVVARARGTRG